MGLAAELGLSDQEYTDALNLERIFSLVNNHHCSKCDRPVTHVDVSNYTWLCKNHSASRANCKHIGNDRFANFEIERLERKYAKKKRIKTSSRRRSSDSSEENISPRKRSNDRLEFEKQLLAKPPGMLGILDQGGGPSQWTEGGGVYNNTHQFTNMYRIPENNKNYFLGPNQAAPPYGPPGMGPPGMGPPGMGTPGMSPTGMGTPGICQPANPAYQRNPAYATHQRNATYNGNPAQYRWTVTSQQQPADPFRGNYHLETHPGVLPTGNFPSINSYPLANRQQHPYPLELTQQQLEQQQLFSLYQQASLAPKSKKPSSNNNHSLHSVSQYPFPPMTDRPGLRYPDYTNSAPPYTPSISRQESRQENRQDNGQLTRQLTRQESRQLTRQENRQLSQQENRHLTREYDPNYTSKPLNRQNKLFTPFATNYYNNVQFTQQGEYPPLRRSNPFVNNKPSPEWWEL